MYDLQNKNIKIYFDKMNKQKKINISKEAKQMILKARNNYKSDCLNS